MVREMVQLPVIDGKQVYMVQGDGRATQYVTANSYRDAEQKARKMFNWNIASAYEAIEVVMK